MKDYNLYQLSGLNQRKLIEIAKLSSDKFNHLYGGFDHSTKYYYLYNFFTIASCNNDTYMLYLETLKAIKKHFYTQNIDSKNTWLQMWMNIHTQTNVLTSHSHNFPIHGYISLTNHNTDTVFTDGHCGNEIYRIQNKPLQMYIGPGYRHHHVEINEDFDGERITLGFDLQLENTMTDNFSFIPIIL